jgi:hypothetical protein
MMRHVLYAFFFTLTIFSASLSAQPASFERQLDSLRQLVYHTQHDSLKFLLYLALAELHFFHSFKHHDDANFRQAELNAALDLLSAAHQFRKTSTSRAIECAVLLERAQFQSRQDALLTLDMCQKELADILRDDPLNSAALATYGALGVELAKIPAVYRLLAQWFYRPIPTHPSLNQALLYLLQAQLLGKYRVFILWKLGEAYVQVRNARDVVNSLRACLDAPEEHPYFDAYCKSRARMLLEQYLSTRQSR